MVMFTSKYRNQSEAAEEDMAPDASVNAEETADSSAASGADGMQEKERSFFARFGSIGLIIITIASSGVAYYFYGQASTLRQNPQKLAQEEVAAVVTRVGQLIMLPEGESPTVATISDVEQLKNQPFFAHAKNGDKVLIYTNARKAILYSPDQNKIIEAAPLNLGGR